MRDDAGVADAMGRAFGGSGGRDRGSRLEREVTNLFDRLFTPLNPLRSSAERSWHPFTDIFESERHVIIRVELAGVDPAAIRLDVEEECLVVRGERHDPHGGRGLVCHQMEISHGPFERVICLPTRVVDGTLRADYGPGFLTITLEKERA